MSERSIISGSSLRTRSGRSQQNETFITLIAQSVINSTYSFTHVPFAKHVYHIVTTQAQINTCQLWRLVLEYRSLKIIREKMKQSSDLTKRQLPKRSTVISTLLIDQVLTQHPKSTFQHAQLLIFQFKYLTRFSFNSFRLYLIPHAWLELPFCAYLRNCVTQLMSIISVTVLLELIRLGDLVLW
ncbi:Hypothetical_protein [Hexamita inflata]|uniref:Hypothetical_protein n=1 Tax=Hexamita inflata TaxID=28002 RepID=A0AA86RHS3_9EUKA|nr:Hypothetical protein HINF_LOCUS62231 [Hexamita inflata]